MWEYWRSRLCKGKTRHRKRTGSDGDSPTAQGWGHCPCLQAIGAATQLLLLMPLRKCLPASQQTGRSTACVLHSHGPWLALSEHAAWHRLPDWCTAALVPALHPALHAHLLSTEPARAAQTCEPPRPCYARLCRQ